MPNDPPPDRILVGLFGGSAPVECRYVTKLHLTLDPEAGSAYAATLAAELQELLPVEVSVTLGG